jgi:hypothetical protein
MANLFRHANFPGDGPTIGRAGYILKVSSERVAGDMPVLVTDDDDRFLLSLIRALGIEADEVARRLGKRPA